MTFLTYNPAMRQRNPSTQKFVSKIALIAYTYDTNLTLLQLKPNRLNSI